MSKVDFLVVYLVINLEFSLFSSQRYNQILGAFTNVAITYITYCFINLSFQNYFQSSCSIQDRWMTASQPAFGCSKSTRETLVNNVGNLFKSNNKYIRTTLLTSFCQCSLLTLNIFHTILVFSLLTLNNKLSAGFCLLWFHEI